MNHLKLFSAGFLTFRGSVNLSSCVAALGKRVLIVDLDPQGNTTTGYGIPKRSVEKGTYEILIGEARASEAIRKTEYRTDVIGSNTRIRIVLFANGL